MLFEKKFNKIDRLEAKQTKIDAKIEEKKSKNKFKITKLKAKATRLNEKVEKIETAEKDFLEKCN